jgi:hypothetical protein
MIKKRTKAQKKKSFFSGVSIVEVMICIVVLLVAILGTTAYQYSAALNGRKANLQATAARTALMIGEAWNGMFGNTTFNPSMLSSNELSINNGDGEDAPTGFTAIGSYKILIENNDYYATLSYKNIDTLTKFRALCITVSWDQCGRGTNSFEQADKSYTLTIYIENPV